MVERWGDAIVRTDGELDRQAVADIVFNDQNELAAIHAMTNVPMEEEIYARVSAHHGTDRVVVLEAALFAGGPKLYGITGLLVVDTPDESAVAGSSPGAASAKRRTGAVGEPTPTATSAFVTPTS